MSRRLTKSRRICKNASANSAATLARRDWRARRQNSPPSSPRRAAPGRFIRIGKRKDALKFSYLVLRKDGKNVLDLRRPGVRAHEKSACWRVVSERLTEKGKQRPFLCGGDGRMQMFRLDRHSTPANRAFGEIDRGDIVQVKGAEKRPQEWRIREETEVKLI